MQLKLFGGTANSSLTRAVARELRIEPGCVELERFPDGEIHVELRDSVRGQPVYLLQPTGPPVAEHLLELLLLADAARRAGAQLITAIVPYLGYARQERRARGREAVGARVVADMLSSARVDRVVALDVHSAALEGFFSVPFEHLTAVPLLAEAARPNVADNTVVVAPDLGATKLAERFATLLGLPVAIVHKTRLSGESVSVRAVTGQVRGRAPLIVDDMISTGGTVVAAAGALLEAGCVPDFSVVASHGLFVRAAAERLAALPLRHIIVTDSLPQAPAGELPMQVVTVAGLLADAIGRLQHGRSLEGLLHH